MSRKRKLEYLPAERRQMMIDWFKNNPSGSNAELTVRFGTSVSTIRRDLEMLASEGIVRRTHGGAIRVRHRTTDELTTDAARRTAVEERSVIVKSAMSLIEDNDSIFIDSGATSHALSEEIKNCNKSLVVVTNDLFVANSLTYKDNIRVVVPGGVLRPGSYTLTGSIGIDAIGEIFCDKYFMTPHALDLDSVSDTTLEVSQLRKAMINSSSRVICLADCSRLFSKAMYRISSLDKISTLITDDNISHDEIELIKDRGVEVLIGKCEEGLKETELHRKI